MNKYILQLLQDILDAHQKITDSEVSSETPKTFEEEMQEIEEWATATSEHTFSYHCGLSKEMFPPAHLLNNKQLKQISDAFEKMMDSYRLDIDLPKRIPQAFRYELIVDTLNKHTFIPTSGFVSFDFCTGDPTDCELKAYCPCLNIRNKEK
jgi:hypothetical protein